MTDAWYHRPKSRRRAIIAASVLVVLVLLLSFSPDYLARYSISDILDDFGIEHDGIESVQINVWKGEVWVGPVRFRGGDSEHGQLGELGVKMRFIPAFSKRAFVENILIRGVDLYVEQDKDQKLFLNGVSLQQFLSDPGENKSVLVKDQERIWGAGLQKFEIRDSQVIFKDALGGTLTLKIQKLQLDNFKSWESDASGTVKLDASINGIKVEMVGQIRPFAKDVSLSLDAKIRDANFGRFIEFIGPLGLERKAGIYNSALHHEITFYESGRLEGHSTGKITVQGADYERLNEFAISLAQAEIEFDTRYGFSETNELTIDGQFDASLNKAKGYLPGKEGFSFETARINIPKLTTSLGADMALHVKANPKIDASHVAFSGRVQLSMDALIDSLRYFQTLSAKKKTSKKQSGLEKWTGGEVVLPTSDITIARFKSNVSAIELKTISGEVSLILVAKNEAKDITVATSERSTNIKSIHNKLNLLKIESGREDMALSVDGQNKFAGINVKGPNGIASVEGLDIKQKIELGLDKVGIRLTGQAKAEVKKMELSVFKTELLPSARVEVAAVTATLKKVNFNLLDNAMLWNLNADSTVEQARIKFAKDSLNSAMLGRLEIKGLQVDQDINIITDVLAINRLEASVTRQLINGVIDDSESGNDEREKPELPSKETELTAPQLKLNLFTSKETKLHFRDELVMPPIHLDVDIETAEVRNIDTHNPQQVSTANLVARINEFTHFEINAQADNVGPEINFAIKGKLDDLELPPFSSYAAEFGGVDIDSGQISSDVKINATKGELDGLIKLNITDLEFTILSEADSQRLSDTVGLPIDTAASLLQDSKGNIDLNLPVVGTVVAPDVEISSAISKVIGNTLLMIFPPTMIGSMLFSEKKFGAGLVFEPIKFKPGSSELDKESLQYLDEIDILFIEHPKLSLDLCGRATSHDFYELTGISLKLSANPDPDEVEQRQSLIEEHGTVLRELARQRTRVARRYLIKEKGLSAKQVGQCRAIFNPDDTSTPRSDIKL